MTEARQRKRPLRVPVGGAMYRRGDRLIDPSRTLWRVDAVDGETVRLETVGGGLRLDLAADALRDWERVWG